MMKKGMDRTKKILLTLVAVVFVIFFLIPLVLVAFNGKEIGNVALIPIEGQIMGSSGKALGVSVVSSKEIVNFIEEANENDLIKAIVLEINSPGGSAVASDEVAAAVKNSKKPVVSLIREVGASGGYWIASATERIVANRMSITGSIGVISSYLEFSELMNKYGIGYEQLTAGEYKDLGTPFMSLDRKGKAILQAKLNKIHDFFIKEVAENRKLFYDEVKNLATGEFYLGVEALDLGLVDELGDINTVKTYLKEEYDIEEVAFLNYRRKVGFLSLLSGVIADSSFRIGEGFGSILIKRSDSFPLI